MGAAGTGATAPLQPQVSHPAVMGSPVPLGGSFVLLNTLHLTESFTSLN